MVVMKASSCHVHPTPAPARTGHGEDAEAGRVASRLGVMPVPPVVAVMSTGDLGHLHVRASCNNAHDRGIGAQVEDDEDDLDDDDDGRWDEDDDGEDDDETEDPPGWSD